MSDNIKLVPHGQSLVETMKIIGKVVTINSQSIRVLLRDNSGKVLLCTGTVSITGAGSGYAKGCLYIKTDAGAGTEGLYRNIGTSSSCSFEALDTISPTEIALTQDKILWGNASNKGEAKTLNDHGAGTSGSGTASITMGGSTASGTASITVAGNADSSTASISMGGNTASGIASITVAGNTDSGGNSAVVTVPVGVFGTWGVDVGGQVSGLVGQEAETPASVAADHAFAFKAVGPVWSQLSSTSGAGGGGVYTGDFQVFPDAPANGDTVYFGFDIPTPAIFLAVSATVGVYTGDATSLEYYNGAGWVAVPSPLYDNTDTTAHDGKRPFQQTGTLMMDIPADWAQTDVNGKTLYWIKYTVTDATKVGTVAILADEHAPLIGSAQASLKGQLTLLTINDQAGTLHTAADVKFILWDSVSGESRSFTFGQDKRRQVITPASPWDIPAGAAISVYCLQEDGTNEPSNVLLELATSQPMGHSHTLSAATATDAGHTHGATGLTATDAGHTHTLTSATATDAGHTHTSTGLTATDAGHTHSTPSLAHSVT